MILNSLPKEIINVVFSYIDVTIRKQLNKQNYLLYINHVLESLRGFFIHPYLNLDETSFDLSFYDIPKGISSKINCNSKEYYKHYEIYLLNFNENEKISSNFLGDLSLIIKKEEYIFVFGEKIERKFKSMNVGRKYRPKSFKPVELNDYSLPSFNNDKEITIVNGHNFKEFKLINKDILVRKMILYFCIIFFKDEINKIKKLKIMG